MTFLARPLLVVALLAAALSTLGCPSFQKPGLDVESAKVTSADFGGATVEVTVSVDNQNAIPLFADRLSYAGKVEGKQVATGEKKERVSLPAKRKTEVKLPVRLSYKELGQAIESMSTKGSWAYVVAGDIGIEPVDDVEFKLPFETTGKIDAPKLPTIKVEKPRIENMSISTLTVAVDVVIDNDNAFALPASSLEGKLVVGDQELPFRQSAPSVAAGKKTTVVVRQPVSLAALASAGRDLVAGKAIPISAAGVIVVAERRQAFTHKTTLKR